MKDDLSRPWVLSFSDTEISPLFPRYRGAFEGDELPPKRIWLGSSFEEGGASARFRAPSFPRRRSFGVSVEIPPEIWHPAGTRRGWHFFTHRDLHLAIYTSLPAAWLAQTPGGKPLPPPWRELWTFGSDHIWACRILDADGGGNREDLLQRFSPRRPSRFTGKILPTELLSS
ncbi:MAG: hypothetical protein DRP60_03235 [Spirochaetes bacterium]|nr:MAG: hypothetical protein DRP60_03235 [Spirochaetota bacterium]